jgi:hypothetical protein
MINASVCLWRKEGGAIQSLFTNGQLVFMAKLA